jgi:hypothetical protein
MVSSLAAILSLSLDHHRGASAPLSAQAALICKSGHLYYGGSEFYANRLQAEASAIHAWRRIKAATYGAARAAKMFPEKEQLHCARATTGEGWRCFVRGAPCHVS